MAKIALQGNGDIDQIAQTIIQGVTSSGISCELVDSSKRENTILLVFEKYYMRAGNRASLSVMVSEGSNDTIYVDSIGAGGGQGVLIRFSWGAEESFVSVISNILTPLGFY